MERDLPARLTHREAPRQNGWAHAFSRWALSITPRALVVGCFLSIWLSPSLVAAFYFGFYASDQYTAEARFTIRPGVPPQLDKPSSDAPMGLISQNTQIIMNYLQSRALVETLERTADLRQLYAADDIDYVNRLARDAKIEKFVRYWKAMTKVSVQPSNGIVTLTVRAFSPETAVKISEACLSASESVVNRLDEDMIKKTLETFDAARDVAASRLSEARAKLEAVRNEEAILSSEQSVNSLTQLMSTVRSDFIKLQQQYDTQSRYLAKDSPRIRNLQNRLTSARTEIERLEAQQTRQVQSDAARSILSDSLAKVDYTSVENRVAEKQYQAAVAMVSSARLASDAKRMYVEVFMRPALSQEALHPHHVLYVALASAVALIACLAATSGLLYCRRMLSVSS